MNASRHLSAYLAIAALLLGNVAGWMHIGCVGVPDSCCAVATGCSHATSSKGVAEHSGHDHSGHDHSGHDHLGHDHCDHAHHGHSQAAGEHGVSDDKGVSHRHASSPAPQTPCSGQVPCEHDSERCSVCHNLFVSRHAALLVDAPVVETDGVAQCAVFRAPIGHPQTTGLGSISVRGPPRV